LIEGARPVVLNNAHGLGAYHDTVGFAADLRALEK
jgi:hypothetical protein